MNLKNAVKIKFIKVHQNMGNFYIGVAKANDVVDICQAEERRVNMDNLEEYLGMQRPLTISRVKELRKYVDTGDATFPNSIILSLNPGSFVEQDGFLYIERDKMSSNILDGQHRLSAFANKHSKDDDFELILTLLPELDIEDQAYLFSVINSKQSKINSSLAQELYDLAKLETPQKVIHTLTLKFNKDPIGPWSGLIKRLGRKTKETEILSQSTFAKGILNLMCDDKDSYSIRDYLKKNDNNRSILNSIFKYKKENKIFWEPYLNYREDFIYKVLHSYFLAISRKFKKEWANDKYILSKTTGYNAFMRLFKVLFTKGIAEKNLSYEYFMNIFDHIDDTKLNDLISDHYNPGAQGEGRLYKDLLNALEINS